MLPTSYHHQHQLQPSAYLPPSFLYKTPPPSYAFIGSFPFSKSRTSLSFSASSLQPSSTTIFPSSRRKVPSHSCLRPLLQQPSSSQVITAAIPSSLLLSIPSLQPSAMGRISLTLLASSCLGLFLENRTKVGSALGASLIAFLSQSILSNLKLVPTECLAYDLCWSKVLPASLSLSVLLAVAAAQDRQSSSSISSKRRRGGRRKVAMAYTFGAIGSLLGAILAYLFTTWQVTLPTFLSSKIIASVAATYVGGSVNFFQVARAVGLDREGPGLLGAVAAADIFLMALYFAALIGMQKSRHISNWLHAGRVPLPSPTAIPQPSWSLSAQNQTSSTFIAQTINNLPTSSFLHRSLESIAALSIALLIGEGGQWIEKLVHLPGLSAGAITLLSILFYDGLRRLGGSKAFYALVRPAGPLSTFLFSLFFAGIGAGASLSHFVTSGPAVMGLMAITLLVHLGFTLYSLRLFNASIFGQTQGIVGIDEMVVASNANIGGPATAAALATSIQRPDLVLPASVTGTIGYALATGLGVALFKVLKPK